MRIPAAIACVAIGASAASAQPAQSQPPGPTQPQTQPRPTEPTEPLNAPTTAPTPTVRESAAAPASVDGLTLEHAIALAESRNERAQIAELDIVVAEAGVMKARAAFLPVVNAKGTDTLKPFDGGDKKPSINSVDAQLTVNQPILVPTAWPLYDAAKHELAEARADSSDDKRTLAFDTAKAYFNVLLADEVLSAAHKKLDTAKADLDDTNAQFKAQLVSSNDVTRAKVGLSGAQRELAQDQGSLDSAYVQLELLVNVKIARNITQPMATLAASELAPPDASELVGASIARRPDLIGRREAAFAAHDAAREPGMRFYPTLAAQGTIQASPNGEQSGHDLDANVALVLSWSIYDAGVRDADARSRGAQAVIADLDVSALARQIDAQVRSTELQLVSAQAALTAAKDAADAAQKSADETSILYRQGLAKAIELIDANEERFVAEVDYAAAKVTVATAYLALRQAMGLDPIGTEWR